MAGDDTQKKAALTDESLPPAVAHGNGNAAVLSAKQQALLNEVESLMRDERMEEGDQWFLVATQWWQQHLTLRGGGADNHQSAPERTADEDEEMAEPSAPNGASDSNEVTNELLVDVEFSSKKRKTVVLKPMLVRLCAPLVFVCRL